MQPTCQPTGLRPTRPGARASGGFTLIELMMTLIIVGILAAVATPKFLDLGKDARIAALNSMRGTLASAATMTRYRCALSASCNAVAQGDLTLNGTTHFVWYGWPIESTREGFWSIAQLIDYSGFSYSSALASGRFQAYFDKPDAPSPSTCRVSYLYQEADLAPTVTITTSGC